MVPGYDDERDVRLLEASHLLDGKRDGPVRWTDDVEKVPGMDEDIRSRGHGVVDDATECIVEVDLTLVEAVGVEPRVGLMAQMGVRNV